MKLVCIRSDKLPIALTRAQMTQKSGTVLVALLAIAVTGACSAKPVTASKWIVEMQCSRAAGNVRCEEYSSDVQVWEIDGEVCGTLNQTTERRSPDAWFSGSRHGDLALVRFVDTFQADGDTFGTAVIKIGKARLTWTVTSTAPGQEVHSEDRYHRESRIDPWDTQDVSSCAELEAKMSGTTVRLPR